jgi:hypothetical protein
LVEAFGPLNKYKFKIEHILFVAILIAILGVSNAVSNNEDAVREQTKLMRVMQTDRLDSFRAADKKAKGEKEN